MNLVNPERGSHKFVKPFHDRVYGEKFTYPDFVPKFTCEVFNPGEIVINDRWGKGDSHKHGGYYTTEYGVGLPNADNP